MNQLEALARETVDCGFRIHKALGPGLLESVYEALLAECLSRKCITVERQKPLPIHFEGVSLQEGYRVDLLVEGTLIVEIKSVERLAAVHGKQLLTYFSWLASLLAFLSTSVARPSRRA